MADKDIERFAEAEGRAAVNADFIKWAGLERQTLAIVFTDIIGSIELNNRIGDDPYGELRRRHFDRARKLLADNSGREIKTIGDAFFAAFRSTGKALDFALALHADPGASEIQIRAGIHTGEMQPDEGDLFGREVNFGARIVGAVRSAEIWLSEPAWTNIDGQAAPRFDDLRWQSHEDIELKGFERAVRLYSLSASAGRPGEVLPSRRAKVIETQSRAGFHRDAQNYDRVDFVSAAEMVIDQPREGHERGVYTQVDFVERLYVENAKARVDFGVRRAYVTVQAAHGGLARSDSLRSAPMPRNARFVKLHDAPAAISVCVDAEPGKISLGEQALPPTPPENYLCRIATAADQVDSRNVQAELRVSLDPEGLYLADELAAKVPFARRKQIEAIITIAARKNHHRVENGEIRRPIVVTERDRHG